MTAKSRAPATVECGTGRNVPFAGATDVPDVADTGTRCHRSAQSSPLEDNGNAGRDPRTITAEEWRSWGAVRHTGMKLVRLKCFDCVYTASEIRKCVQTTCPLWPYRMGSVPKGLRLLDGAENADDGLDSEASAVSVGGGQAA
jgi:hypothetical protein